MWNYAIADRFAGPHQKPIMLVESESQAREILKQWMNPDDRCVKDPDTGHLYIECGDECEISDVFAAKLE